MPKRTFALFEVTWVLMQKRRQDRPCHVVLDGSVGKRRAKSLSVAGRTLAVSGFAVLRLADAGKKSIPRDLHIVEGAARHHRKFLLRGERRHMPGVFQSQKIRQGIKKPVIRRSRYFSLRACASRNVFFWRPGLLVLRSS